jgi:hypothetical protein
MFSDALARPSGGGLPSTRELPTSRLGGGALPINKHHSRPQGMGGRHRRSDQGRRENGDPAQHSNFVPNTDIHPGPTSCSLDPSRGRDYGTGVTRGLPFSMICTARIFIPLVVHASCIAPAGILNGSPAFTRWSGLPSTLITPSPSNI